MDFFSRGYPDHRIALLAGVGIAKRKVRVRDRLATDGTGVLTWRPYYY